jgi:hypothetical protein
MANEIRGADLVRRLGSILDQVLTIVQDSSLDRLKPAGRRQAEIVLGATGDSMLNGVAFGWASSAHGT